MSQQTIRFGIIGSGMMGRVFAAATMRWAELRDMDVRPEIVGVAGRTAEHLGWFEENLPTVRRLTTDYHDLLAAPDIDAIYCAVPHYLHAAIYADIIRAGKHLLGEKPFGMDLAANLQIMEQLAAHPQVFARCSSQWAFFPGAYQIAQWQAAERFGKIIAVEAGFWHSSDLDPHKPINWKRQVAYNGAYGCLGDLGLHVLYLPLRAGWLPSSVSAVLTKIITQRPDGMGGMVPCDTWDNAELLCTVASGGNQPAPGCTPPTTDYAFPAAFSFRRISPGETNTWYLRVLGTAFSAEFSTKYPRTLRTMPFEPGQPQAWQSLDLGYQSAYPVVAGGLFEFGQADAMLQMVAAFCDELVAATGGRPMHQPFGCATPAETTAQHRIFTAALASQRTGQTVPV
jgi:predicted dehydrogenase